jgi:hypothetical protein
MELLDFLEKQDSTTATTHNNLSTKRWKTRYRLLIVIFLTCILLLEVLKSLRQIFYEVRSSSQNPIALL